jgi:hypothetical protein
MVGPFSLSGNRAMNARVYAVSMTPPLCAPDLSLFIADTESALRRTFPPAWWLILLLLAPRRETLWPVPCDGSMEVLANASDTTHCTACRALRDLCDCECSCCSTRSTYRPPGRDSGVRVVRPIDAMVRFIESPENPRASQGVRTKHREGSLGTRECHVVRDRHVTDGHWSRNRSRNRSRN